MNCHQGYHIEKAGGVRGVDLDGASTDTRLGRSSTLPSSHPVAYWIFDLLKKLDSRRYRTVEFAQNLEKTQKGEIVHRNVAAESNGAHE